ncbi:30S ribosomal protein S4 [Pseudomonas mandelii JR-1]|uniref:30S ribosomal protein S4 n=1 Tax=Pseudomonas mandelii JR-1 TaxID=1147786 RepID=A0A024EE50_9PSED|nr:30S ribosomal protein S4 [Pseudomonas mandelii JR-1]
MRDWRHVGDAGDLVATAVQSADCRFTTWAWTFDVNVEVFQTVFQRSLTSTFSSYLSSKRGGLAGTAETRTTGGSPGKSVALTVGDGHDCVVKRCMDVGDAINHCLFNFFTRTSSRFSHD